MILSFIGDTLMIMTQLISKSMEGLFELLKNIFTIILDFIIIFIRFGSDGISGVVYYFINQFSTIFKVTGDSIGVLFELLINLFSWIGDKIFNYMKKFYMTINNIQAE
jgi:flagellar biosynthesis protein FlhB